MEERRTDRPVIVARHDSSLVARIRRRHAMYYDRGADASEDRPAHARSASAIVRFGGDLWVVQDDALFLARIDERTARVSDVMLPRGPGGLRLYDDTRGNKADKLDLESAAVVESPGGDILVAFGSGSTSKREQVVLVRAASDLRSAPEVRVVSAPDLYARMRDDLAFSGSELNLEGAVAVDGEIVFFQRGNGKVIGDRLPVSATARVSASELLAHLEGRGPCPPLRAVQAYDLGVVAGAPLTFTDATLTADGLLYVASAEASPDVTRDGEVVGTAMGYLDTAGDGPRFAYLVDEHGDPSCDKVEGIIATDDGQLLGVVDQDDPDAPAELLWIEFPGAPAGRCSTST